MKKLLLTAFTALCTLAFEANAAESQVVLNDDGTVTITVRGSGSNKLGSGQVVRQQSSNNVFPWENAWLLFNDETHSKYGQVKMASPQTGSNMLSGGGANGNIPENTDQDLVTAATTYNFSMVDAGAKYYISGYSVNCTITDGETWTVNGKEITQNTVVEKSFSFEDTSRQLVLVRNNGSTNMTLADFTITLTKNPAMSFETAANQLTAYLAPWVNSLKACSFISDEEAATAFASITITEQEDVEDYADMLETTKADANKRNECIYNLLKEKLDGKNVSLKTVSPMYTQGAASGNLPYVAVSTFDVACVWTIKFADNAIKLYNPAHNNWANGLTAAEDGTPYQLELLTHRNGYFGIKNPAQSGNNYWNDNNNGFIRYFTCNAGNTSSFYSLTPVTEWPVAIHADGWGSIVSPFDLVVPEGCTVIAPGSLNDKGQVVFAEVEDIIPAGTHAFIYAGTGVTTVNVPIADGLTEFNPYKHGDFIGHHFEQTIEAADSTNYYAKLPVADSGVSTASIADVPAIKLQKLDITDGNVAIPAGVAVVSLKSKDYNDDVISLTASEPLTTSICEVGAASPMADIIYDLQGRRLTRAHGLVIMNGRKVFVK